MEAKPHGLAFFQSPAALRRWCILAGLALAPLPAFHAVPEGFLIYLFLLIRATTPVGMYVLNMFCMRGSRLWGSRLHRACVV